MLRESFLDRLDELFQEVMNANAYTALEKHMLLLKDKSVSLQEGLAIITQPKDELYCEDIIDSGELNALVHNDDAPFIHPGNKFHYTVIVYHDCALWHTKLTVDIGNSSAVCIRAYCGFFIILVKGRIKR